MLKPRWRKVLADLWNNKARTLLVVASVAVGVFAIGVIAGTYVILSEDLRVSYQAINPANIELLVDPFDPDFLEAIEHVDGVSVAEGRQSVTVRMSSEDGEWQTLTLIAVSGYEDMRIDTLLPRGGAEVPADHEVILEANTLDSLALSVGDQLAIELPDETVRQMAIAGSAIRQDDPYAVILDDWTGFVTFDTLEWLHQPALLTRLKVTVEGDGDDLVHIEQVAAAVVDRVEESGRQVYRTSVARSSEHPLASIIQALLSVLSILGVLIVFLSGSLIANTMSALLSQHLRHIGVMKLIGGRRNQVVVMYLVMITAFGLLALAIAIPLGSLGAYALSEFAANIIGFVMQGYRIVPLAVILQIIIALAVPPFAGVLPILKGSRVSIRDALSNDGLASEGGLRCNTRLRNFILPLTERLGASMRKLSRPLLVSIRNTFRRKARLALTLFTLTLGGAVFIAVLNTQVALNVKMEQLAQYFKADISLDLDRAYRIEDVTADALSVPGVQSIEVWTASVGEIVRTDGLPPKNVTILAPPAESDLVVPVLIEGRWLLFGDEKAIALSEAFWDDYPELRPGSTLRLNVAGAEDDWTVVGVFQYTGVDDLFAYVNYDYMVTMLDQPRRASVYRIVTSEHSLDFQKRVSRQLDEKFRALGYRVNSIEAGEVTAQSVSDVLGVLTTVLVVMALLTALVGSIGLAGTMSMNVMERTREIGVLRAIGAHNSVISRLVLVEGLAIGLISYVFGAFLSFPITDVLSNVISEAIFNSPADSALTIQGFGIWLGIVVVLSLVASLMPARSATRLTIREVLAYE
ncbi:MAG: FtsX-like permease family protein [Anaerolineae bacterium]|nr:FtsX-like permease family protein [Anaerolineae bacterium]